MNNTDEKGLTVASIITYVIVSGIVILVLTSCEKLQKDYQLPAYYDVINFRPSNNFLLHTEKVIAQNNPAVNLLYNGGGSNTSDWVGENIATGWSEVTGNATVGTGNGFEGNYQRIECSGGQFVLRSPGIADDGRQYHRFTFRYRCSTRINVVIMVNERCPSFHVVLNPSSEISTFNQIVWSPLIWCIKFYNQCGNAGYLEIDNVNIY